MAHSNRSLGDDHTRLPTPPPSVCTYILTHTHTCTHFVFSFSYVYIYVFCSCVLQQSLVSDTHIPSSPSSFLFSPLRLSASFNSPPPMHTSFLSPTTSDSALTTPSPVHPLDFSCSNHADAAAAIGSGTNFTLRFRENALHDIDARGGGSSGSSGGGGSSGSSGGDGSALKHTHMHDQVDLMFKSPPHSHTDSSTQQIIACTT